MIPMKILDLAPLTPPPPPVPGYPFWRGGGSKLLDVLHFIVYGLPNPWRGSRVQTPAPLWALVGEDFAILILDRRCSGT